MINATEKSKKQLEWVSGSRDKTWVAYVEEGCFADIYKRECYTISLVGDGYVYDFSRNIFCTLEICSNVDEAKEVCYEDFKLHNPGNITGFRWDWEKTE